jgi:hypothetical protein
MNLRKKWGAAVAGALSLALVAGGAAAAHAAPGDATNPQSNGSKGSFFLWNADTAESAEFGTSHVYSRTDGLIASANASNIHAEINPAATRPVSGSTAFTDVYVFLSDPTADAVAGGRNTWKAHHVDSAAGANGGTYLPDMTLDSLANGIDAVIATGGTYWYGIAYTINNGVTTVGAVYRQITITAGTGDYTVGPVETDSSVAPAITTQPANASVNPGATASFTAAASGTPAPSVQWQSSADGTSWADVSGATSATLSVTNAAVAQSGVKYRAVFTNSKGSATSDAATLTVNRVAPDQPSGSDDHKVTIPAPAAGATSVVVPAGIAHANGTLQAWAWSTPTDLGQVTTDANGDATVSIAGLPAGTHTIALTQPGDSAFAVVAWGTIEIASQAGDPLTDGADLSATVTASDLWSLNAEKTAIDFGSVQRNASATRALGKVTVVDDRSVLKGWNLDASWSKFTAGTDEIPVSALALTPKAYAGSTLLSGVTLGTTGSKIAESTAVSTLAAGALFDADLTFTAPKDAKAGQYHSTLTLTLTSK